MLFRSGEGIPWLETGPALYDTDASRVQVQGDLFGATLPEPGELAGQASLFEGDL